MANPNEIIKINRDTLLQLVRDSTFGTGTLSSATRISGDTLQQLIGRGEGDETLVSNLEGMLGSPFRVAIPETEGLPPLQDVLLIEKPEPVIPFSDLPDEVPEDHIDVLALAESCSVEVLKAKVDRGLLDAFSLLQAEKSRLSPRTTLTSFLIDFIHRHNEEEEE